MQSDNLLSSEDEGMGQLLMLNDLVCNIIDNHDTVVITNGVTQEHETLTTMSARVSDHTTYIHFLMLRVTHQLPDTVLNFQQLPPQFTPHNSTLTSTQTLPLKV